MVWCWGGGRGFKNMVMLDLALERHKENCGRKAHRWQTRWTGHREVLPGWTERKRVKFLSWLMTVGGTNTEMNLAFLRPPPGPVPSTVLLDVRGTARNARASAQF